MTTPSPPSQARTSNLPDYYAEERRALREARRREQALWLAVAVASLAVLVMQVHR